MKDKRNVHSGVKELCRKLKGQLDELSIELVRDTKLADEEIARRSQLLERLKNQLAELSN